MVEAVLMPEILSSLRYVKSCDLVMPVPICHSEA